MEHEHNDRLGTFANRSRDHVLPERDLARGNLVGNDDGILNFHFGGFVHDAVGPVIDIFLNRHGDWSFGPRAIDRFP